MKLLTFATLAAFSGFAAAQVSAIPQCALDCFGKAIAKTDCGLNTYCQCTSGAKVIQSSVIKCLCDTNACSASELVQLQKASNDACSAALASSSQTYSAATIPNNVCQTAGGGTTGTASLSSLSGKITNTGANTVAAASSSSAGSSSSGSGAMPTLAPLGRQECAAIAIGAMALFGM